jgi:hypothetical protein
LSDRPSLACRKTRDRDVCRRRRRPVDDSVERCERAGAAVGGVDRCALSARVERSRRARRQGGACSHGH